MGELPVADRKVRDKWYGLTAHNSERVVRLSGWVILVSICQIALLVMGMASSQGIHKLHLSCPEKWRLIRIAQCD